MQDVCQRCGILVHANTYMYINPPMKKYAFFSLVCFPLISSKIDWFLTGELAALFNKAHLIQADLGNYIKTKKKKSRFFSQEITRMVI